MFGGMKNFANQCRIQYFMLSSNFLVYFLISVKLNNEDNNTRWLRGEICLNLQQGNQIYVNCCCMP